LDYYPANWVVDGKYLKAYINIVLRELLYKIPMATVAGMSGIDIKAVVVELIGKLPLWIDKVYQFDPRTPMVRLWCISAACGGVGTNNIPSSPPCHIDPAQKKRAGVWKGNITSVVPDTLFP